jgi:nucleotide-binding universal stress UspA family protein
VYNTILAPLDGSKLSECALAHVKEVAAGCHVGKVILLNVMEQRYPLYADYGNREQVEQEIREKKTAQDRQAALAEKYLDAAKNTLIEQGLDVITAAVPAEEFQSPADLILNYAEKNKVDLIVMSTHGRSGITRWAFGSVADRVVRHSKIPVLTIAPAGCRL